MLLTASRRYDEQNLTEKTSLGQSSSEALTTLSFSVGSYPPQDRETIFTPKLLHSHYWDSSCRQQSIKHKRFSMDWQVFFVSIQSEHKNKTCMQKTYHYYLVQASWNSATIEIHVDSVLHTRYLFSVLISILHIIQWFRRLVQ